MAAPAEVKPSYKQGCVSRLRRQSIVYEVFMRPLRLYKYSKWQKCLVCGIFNGVTNLLSFKIVVYWILLNILDVKNVWSVACFYEEKVELSNISLL